LIKLISKSKIRKIIAVSLVEVLLSTFQPMKKSKENMRNKLNLKQSKIFRCREVRVKIISRASILIRMSILIVKINLVGNSKV